MILEIIIFSAFAILVGLAFTFFGYPFFRVLLPIWAFFVGLWFGIGAVSAFLGTGFLPVALGLVVGFVFGLIFAAIAYFVFSLAVVLFGASLGFSLGSGFLLLLGINEGFLTFTAGLILAVLFAIGFAALRMPRLIIVIATAFSGAMAVITGILVLFGQLPPTAVSFDLTSIAIGDSILWLLVWIALGVFGIMTQYAMTRGEDLYEAYSVETSDVPPAPAEEKPV